MDEAGWGLKRTEHFPQDEKKIQVNSAAKEPSTKLSERVIACSCSGTVKYQIPRTENGYIGAFSQAGESSGSWGYHQYRRRGR